MSTTFSTERDQLKASFSAGALATFEARRAALDGIVQLLSVHCDEFIAALATDMGRPRAEADAEVCVAIREARDISSNLEAWMRPERKGTHTMMQPAEAAVRRSPFGAVLIIGPYNYPLVLTIEPLIGALAAGNTVLLKPSELTPATSSVLARCLPKYLSPTVCQIATGGIDVSTALLATKWDFIYFTGSPRVGKIVAKAAAEHMTPTALELGGKAPAIVHESAAIREAARRIINTKAINAGQTCMAPDYILVDAKKHDELLAALTSEIREQFGDEPSASPDYGRMCSPTHYDRMLDLLAKSGGRQVRVGSAPPDRASKYVPLTIVDEPPRSAPVLHEEIFGPLLPVLTYASVDDAVALVRAVDPTPLALYVFAQADSATEALLEGIQSGTVVVNDCVVQHLCHTLPFGGVGTSGHGVCHGRFSYETFTYPRAVLWRSARFDIDQTVPMPLRHCSAAASPKVRPMLLRLMLLYGPYFTSPRAWQLFLALAAALVARAFALRYRLAAK